MAAEFDLEWDLFRGLPENKWEPWEGHMQCVMKLLTPDLLVQLIREVPLRQETINKLYNSLRFQQYGFVHLRVSYKGLERSTLNLENLTDSQFRLLEEFTLGNSCRPSLREGSSPRKR